MSQVDVSAAIKAAKEIVYKAAQEDTLHELTPKQVRNKVEEQLGLKKGTLEEGEYKKKLKTTIEAAVAEVQANFENETDGKPDSRPKESKFKAKPTSSSTTSPPKEKEKEKEKKADLTKSKSKEKLTATASRKRKSGEEPEDAKPKTKAKKPKVVKDEEDSEKKAGPSKGIEKKVQKEKVVKGEAKKGDVFKSREAVESSDEEETKGIDTSPRSKKVTSPGKPVSVEKKPLVKKEKESVDEKGKEKRKDKEVLLKKERRAEEKNAGKTKAYVQKDDDTKSESELSVLIDEPPKKKRGRKSKDKDDSEPKAKKSREKSSKSTMSPDEEQVKKLKALVVACGVRKVWSRELKDMDAPSKQISHIRSILADLGMKGRFSMEQAKAIKAKRELAQEMEDVREFAERHAMGERASRSKAKQQAKNAEESDADDDKENSDSEDDGGKPRRRNARQSIMAFLQDQSDSD